MSAYFVAQLTIHDAALYEKYLDGFDAIFARYQGEVVAVDENPAVLEGACRHKRIVLIRFPDEVQLRCWYDSPEYQAIAQIRHSAAEGDVLLVHGREEATRS
ncbi:MAG TPA: DUF1330 domain-containing protein [Symbiobacteriaceae bacterium]|nr:DUF1330 domain-containing protein [Symbiobacteriaceae bacterium]